EVGKPGGRSPPALPRKGDQPQQSGRWPAYNAAVIGTLIRSFFAIFTFFPASHDTAERTRYLHRGDHAQRPAPHRDFDGRTSCVFVAVPDVYRRNRPSRPVLSARHPPGPCNDAGLLGVSTLSEA